MRLALYSLLFLGLLTSHLNADIVDAVATPTTPGSVHYSFTLSGFNLLQYQVLDLEFSPSTYSALSNASAPAGFSTTIDPINTPPGAPGSFLIEALTSNPPLTPGSIGIDAKLAGSGGLGPLQFTVYQFSSSGTNAINEGPVNGASGMTTDSAVPEPAGVSLVVLGLLAALISGSRWRHRDNRFSREFHKSAEREI
jgi:hypothetical protein